MGIMVGSARLGENGSITGGKAGDQTGKEVSTQAMYNSSKGWYIIRPKDVNVANKIAEGMLAACNNNNIGYNQNERLGIIKYGVNSAVKCNADCSSTVRACCIYAGFDPGNFTTANEATVLANSGKFQSKISYVSQDKTPVYNGDILVTKTKGHTVVVVSGNPRQGSTNQTVATNTNYTYGGVNYSAVFDASYYANKYADLKSAFGNDSKKLFNHFCTNGMKEGRQAISTFNVQAYKNNYADLQKAFGNDLPSYYKHYCTNGKAEGRKAV